MRNTRCPFCPKIFNDKHKYCAHIAAQHNEQVPEDQEPLEFAYSLLTHKPPGRLCVMCRKNPVNFNQQSLKYDRICSNPQCKDDYVKLMKSRMVKVHGQEHLLNDADMQRKMIYNNHNARDFIWDDQHKFRVIGTYEEDFLKKLRAIGWSPNDVIAPSPNNYWYKWKDGTTHLYIPDFYIPSLSLEIEIKESDNKHPRMVHEREMEALKDRRLHDEEKKTNIHYLKIVDKNYDEFMRDYVKSDMNKPE